MPRLGSGPLSSRVAFLLLTAVAMGACDIEPDAVAGPESPVFAKGGNGKGKGGGNGGGTGSPATLEFLTERAGDAVVAGAQGGSGSNDDDGVTVTAGTYTLTYTVAPGACSTGGLVELLSDAPVTGSLSLVADREAEPGSGAFDPPGRVTVSLSGVKNPNDSKDRDKYTVTLSGDPVADADIFDPDTDVGFTEVRGAHSTVAVSDQAITVERYGRGNKLVDSERCRAAGTYTFRVAPGLPLRAFPGAEGFGGYASGGRGGAVYYVSNLNDDGPGSLRAALEAAGARTVVFEVAGYINLASALTVTNDDFTIAGQTAPGDGITLRGQMVRIDASNFIVRHIRFRRGTVTPSDPTPANDALQIGGTATNGILDHCSVSWGRDEVLDIDGSSTDLTVQWCVISEGLHQEDHGFGFRIGGASDMRISVHHNVIAHAFIRLPSISYVGTAPSDGLSMLVDFRNNVRYNWVQGNQIKNNNSPGSLIEVNYIGNHSTAGPSTGAAWFDEAARGNLDNNVELVRIYESDNLMNGSDLGRQAFGDSLTFVNQPFPVDAKYAVTTDSPLLAFDRVVLDAGATVPARDAVDQRVLTDVQQGTGRIINTQDDVGGWPPLAGGTPPLDTDRDGMPDSWETARGLDPNDPTDRNGDPDGNGYTHLEEYLNELAGSS